MSMRASSILAHSTNMRGRCSNWRYEMAADLPVYPRLLRSRTSSSDRWSGLGGSREGRVNIDVFPQPVARPVPDSLRRCRRDRVRSLPARSFTTQNYRAFPPFLDGCRTADNGDSPQDRQPAVVAGVAIVGHSAAATRDRPTAVWHLLG